jgi:hypothetical protein
MWCRFLYVDTDEADLYIVEIQRQLAAQVGRHVCM